MKAQERYIPCSYLISGDSFCTESLSNTAIFVCAIYSCLCALCLEGKSSAFFFATTCNLQTAVPIPRASNQRHGGFSTDFNLEICSEKNSTPQKSKIPLPSVGMSFTDSTELHSLVKIWMQIQFEWPICKKHFEEVSIFWLSRWLADPEKVLIQKGLTQKEGSDMYLWSEAWNWVFYRVWRGKTEICRRSRPFCWDMSAAGSRLIQKWTIRIPGKLNAAPISAMLFCTRNLKISEFERILRGTAVLLFGWGGRFLVSGGAWDRFPTCKDCSIMSLSPKPGRFYRR